MLDSVALRARLDGVRERIARAAGRVGRDPASVLLVAVSKTFPVEQVRAAADAGQTAFGENKVQEALQKIDATAGLPLRWHLLGHLQSNKVRKAAAVDVVHSVHHPAILRGLDEAAAALGRRIDVLIQVDLAGEATKHGARPEALDAIFAAARSCRAVAVTGLMLLPPAVEAPEAARPHFAALRALRDRLLDQGVEASMLRDLSMGMSHDFEIAIEEGATIVRVGSAIFGPRGAHGGQHPGDDPPRIVT